MRVVKETAGLSDSVMGKSTLASGDSAVSRWFAAEMPKTNAELRKAG